MLFICFQSALMKRDKSTFSPLLEMEAGSLQGLTINLARLNRNLDKLIPPAAPAAAADARDGERNHLQSKSSRFEQTAKAKRKIQTARDLLDAPYYGYDSDDGEDVANVEFRLRGLVPPGVGERPASVAAAERDRVASAVRDMKQSCHQLQQSLSSKAAADAAATTRKVKDRLGGESVTAKKTSKGGGSGGVWLACLNAVATDYRRAEADSKAAEQKMLVRQRKEARERGREMGVAELERQKSWTNYVELTERRAITAALDQRAEVEKRTAASYRAARGRLTALESDRRRQVTFADDVVRRVQACARANKQFVASEWREAKARRALDTVADRHDDEADRLYAVKRTTVARQLILQARTGEERAEVRAILEDRSANRELAVKKRLLALKEERLAALAEPRSIISLPIISSPE
jgi:hypothetical protein